MEIRYIELFAGIGGFRYGLERCSIKDTKEENKGIGNKEGQLNKQPNRSSDGFTCVYANEWDKYVCQIYRKNFGEGELYEGDIREVSAESIPDYDLLTAGFPCQSFSIAGKRKGFGDTRGTLFFEICRIVEKKKPYLLLLENVKGILSHDGGDTFRVILNSLSELGYDCEWEVLNSKNFGVPQNRERVFIVGHLRGKGGQKVFPIGGTTQGTIKVRARGKHQQDIVYDTSGILNLPAGTHGSTPHLTKIELKYEGAIMSEKNKKWLEDGKKLSRNFPQGQRVYSDKGIASTIAGNAGGLGGKTGLYTIKNVGSVNPSGKGQSGNVVSDKGISFTISAGGGNPNRFPPRDIGYSMGNILTDTKIRRLTPTECERLQGFPDGWTEGISDTQRYKCLGNAVTTNVITEIGKKILGV